MTQAQEKSTTENTSLAVTKLTAAQVENDCPGELQDLAKHINTHLDKARKYEDRANQHTTSAAQHLARAKELCDDGGLEAFRKKFCPDLGRSRLYELLSIGNEKKSNEEVKADTRARVARHRAKKADLSITVTEKLEPEAHESFGETAEASVTVTEKSEAATEAQDEEGADVEGHTTPVPAKSRGAVTPKDDSMIEFTSLACRLLQKIAKFPPRHFQKTGIKADELAKLGRGSNPAARNETENGRAAARTMKKNIAGARLLPAPAGMLRP